MWGVYNLSSDRFLLNCQLWYPEERGSGVREFNWGEFESTIFACKWPAWTWRRFYASMPVMAQGLIWSLSVWIRVKWLILMLIMTIFIFSASTWHHAITLCKRKTVAHSLQCDLHVWTLNVHMLEGDHTNQIIYSAWLIHDFYISHPHRNPLYKHKGRL